MMACMMAVPAVDADAFSNIEGETLVAVESEHEYIFTYESSEGEFEYNAKLVNGKGETQTSAVSPSTGTVSGTVTLDVEFPKTAGDYTLVVEVSAEGEDSEVVDEVSLDIEVVEPVTLTVTLSTAEDLDLTGFGVYFFIDGQKMEDSYTTFDLVMAGSAEVTYDWIVSPDGDEHTFWVEPAVEGVVVVEGLGEKHTFYFGDNDYTLYSVFSVVLVVVLAIILIWVYRKPVKNFGKPKSRR
ncbi:MAG: hypothetical protein IKD00_01300 [Candidatus Methanomethylophilaceae archaeon]|nr:hypothetical protein [Candidatus Methanomethylophilaceae archaeon]